METSKISSTSSSNSRTTSKSNIVLSMPNITAPIKGSVASVSKDGIMNIKTSLGEVKLYSSSPLTSGETVLISISKNKEDLQIKTISSATSSSDNPVDSISNNMTEDQNSFLVFKMPNRFKNQLAESVQLYPTFSAPTQGLKSSPEVHIDSAGIIQFMSYISRGGLSDSFGKAMAANPSLATLFPTLNNLSTSIPSYLKKIESKNLTTPESKKLQNDLDNLQNLTEQLSDDEWNFVLVPINDGQKLLSVKVFTKHEQILEDEDLKTRRFIVELDMDKLGTIVIDGLITNKNQQQNLSISVRSSNPLPEELEQEIRELFEMTSDITGQSGNLSFTKASNKDISMTAKALHEYCKEKIKYYWA